MYTGSQHAFINEKTYTDSAQLMMGLIEAAPGNGRTVRWRVTSTRPRRLGKTPEESWGLPSDGASGSQSLFVKKEG